LDDRREHRVEHGDAVDAVELALANGVERNEEARQWAAVSRSADFPE